MKLKLKTYPAGSKSDVLQTFVVGVLVMVPLPLLIIALVFFGGPVGFFAGLAIGLWGAVVGRHLLEAIRDGVAAYGYAKASKAWDAK